MDLEREVEYRMSKWVFANLYHWGEVDEENYHLLLNRLLEDYDPPMKSIEERFDMSEREENNQGREFANDADHGADKGKD